MIEFTYADTHEHAVMIVFMNACLALITMPHAHPTLNLAYLASPLLPHQLVHLYLIGLDESVV